ncbi:MAG: hypothetical protein M1825_004483 [Sarcosagium campestre]|nr:MAG: hypothetical protein M1825_004483 [Sarcosagium campestre]
MSIQTRVLADGVWVTRNIDIQTILQHNREQQLPKAPMTCSSSAPSVGVLSRTLVQSPKWTWIIPARIRHKDRNDVVFIGDSQVQIKELCPDGHLEEVAVKSDFPSRILHARVIGLPRKDAPSGLDAYIKKESDDDFFITDDADTSMSDFADNFVLKRIPPHILVLSLECGSLLFMFAYFKGDGTVDFMSSLYPMSHDQAKLDMPGKQIAVDSQSRALAVASSESAFTIYALHSMSKLRRDIERHDVPGDVAFLPVKQERSLEVDGIILKMEFLHPPQSDSDNVILLLMVCKDCKSRLWIYNWHSSLTLDYVERQGSKGLELDPSDRLPLLLIPLKIALTFLLVSRSTMSLYTGVLPGTFERVSFSPLPSYPPEDQTLIEEALLCTSWARPARTEKFSFGNDCVYICREDGSLFYVEIDKSYKGLVKLTAPCGRVRGPVNTAFAILDFEVDHPADLIVVAGDMSIGGLYMLPAAQRELECIETISDWTPVTDFVTVSGAKPNPKPSAQPGVPVKEQISAKQERLFACTGKGNHGSITEIRRGLEARVGTVLSYVRGVNQISSFTDPQHPGILLLCSFPLHTDVLHLSADLKAIEQINDADVPDLDLDSRTFAAGFFRNLLVQVTEHSIHISNVYPSQFKPEIPGVSRKFADSDMILHASINSLTSSILIVVRKETRFELRLVRCVFEEGSVGLIDIGQPSVIADVPSCLSTILIAGNLYALVGTAASDLQVFCCDAVGGITRCLTLGAS